MRLDDRQLFDLHRLVEDHAASAAFFDDKDSRLGGQDETVIRPRVAADDLVVEIRIEALRLPRLCVVIVVVEWTSAMTAAKTIWDKNIINEHIT